MAGSDGKKVGAVLVIGGGVGGMQASLDLAEAGLKVYLLEKESSIGGTMARLDKTFPTNDCSMCIVAPRLVEVGRHLNIEVITNAELESLSGKAGDFTARIKKKARYIDLDKCTGCSACVEKCPVQSEDEFNLGLAKRTAIYRRYPQAVPSAFAIDKTGVSPCRLGCPAGVNAHAYVTLIARKRFAEALEIVREKNPFPAVCGRVCTHPCETECRRGDLDEPIAICSLKRFLADWESKLDEIPKPKLPEKRQEKIAVIGSGPAGLTAARDLALKGYQVTVFEKLPVAGGMLAVGIPEYRLPKAVLKKEIETILAYGIEIQFGKEFGKDLSIDQLKAQGYRAIFLAIGTHKGLKMRIPGEDEFEGVWDCIEFLRKANLAEKVKMGKKVVVIGGGNAAVDSARSALRMGAQEVTIIYRRSRNEMPANSWEVEEAELEGVKILFLSAPVRVLEKDGKVHSIECLKMKLGEPDASGRSRPVPIEGSNFTLETDMIISAIGQEPETELIKKQGINHTHWNLLEVNPMTLQTNQDGVFAGGDAVSGPSTVVEAMAMGQKASESIHLFLQGERLYKGYEVHTKLKAVKDLTGLAQSPRRKMPKLPREARLGNNKEVELGFTEEMAIAEAQRCLNCAGCCECLQCLLACEAKAINHEMVSEKEIKLNVGAVIVAPGFDLFQAEQAGEYGFGRYPNVMTSLQFERLLSASGPTMGKLTRPSDGKVPRKVAFIQCVGSRSAERNYCSSVCCMYATKEAVIAMEHEHGLDCTIFFIDLRAFGKGFDDYYLRAQQHGVKYTRCLPSTVKEVPGTKNLILQYISPNPGKVLAEEFDLVVLATGLCPPADFQEMGKRLGINLDQYGFCLTSRFEPVDTNRAGVFVCGPFVEPKDIPETVMQASGAAGKVMSFLAEQKGTLVRKKEYPPERDVKGQEPRIGVFVCHCGKNIGGVISSKAVAEYAATLPNVVFATDKLYTCSQDSIQAIKQAIAEHKLNRVVVAACSPRTHEPLFRDVLREAGLNLYLFEMTNIRDQCTWVHMHEPEKAFKKAKDLVRMAIARSRLLEPLYKRDLEIIHKALVIGGGLAGMTAALELASQGFETYLVEKEKQLGGNLRKVRYLLEGEQVEPKLQRLIMMVSNHPKIQLFLDTQIKAINGSLGNFRTIIHQHNQEHALEHGVVIVAVGAEEYKPKEYLYGQDPRVMTQLELESRLAQGAVSAKTVAMIQCVGSRDEERTYCSRICCSEAVKNALKIKELSPQTNVYILYRDMRTYGFREKYYRKAREQGVVFIRYEPEKKPQVENKDGQIQVTVSDLLLGKEILLKPDLLVLSAGVVARKEDKAVAQMLKVPQTQDGFFLEAHMKLRPVDFSTEGVFLAGLAHASKDVDESISQACAASARASTILSKPVIELEATISQVLDANCDGCAYCVDPCPYKAISLIEYVYQDAVKKTVEVNSALCKGCGVCQATCPKKGIFVNHFKLEQIMAQIQAALEV